MTPNSSIIHLPANRNAGALWKAQSENDRKAAFSLACSRMSTLLTLNFHRLTGQRNGGLFVMKHTAIGDKYLKAMEGKRMFARGVFWGYEKGVWIALPNHKSEIWEICKASKCSPSSGLVYSITEYVSGALYRDETELDNKADLVNLKNGALNIRTLKLAPHSPAHLFTAQLGFSYDDKATCPNWEKFIREVLVTPRRETDIDMIAFVQEAFGYSLTASVEHEISFWLIGEGANGKSTMMKILDAIAGSAALHLNLGMLDRDKYQLADLGGKRVVICTEAPDTTVSDSILKLIISGDRMNVRSIYGKPFVVNPIAKVWWAMNNPPRVNDTSEGFWRKTKVIPFNRTFDYDERDKKLLDKLKSELPGIFNWALAGLKRLEQTGYFTECEQIEDATLSYRDESDLPLQFLNECLERDSESSETSSDMYHRYRAWCKENGYKPASSIRMGREWRRLGLKSGRENGKRIWIGVKFLSDATILDFK